MRYLKTNDGFVFEWNPILAENPLCREVSEEEAFPEKFIPEGQKGRKAKVNLTTDEVPEEPSKVPNEIAIEASKGLK